MFRGDGGGRVCRVYRSPGVGVAQLSLHARRRGETLEEERLSYLRSLQRHAAVEYGEVRRVLALKRGVGDHTPERFADHELGSARNRQSQIQIEMIGGDPQPRSAPARSGAAKLTKSYAVDLSMISRL